MEEKVSEVLENILGLLALEGSFEVNEGPEEILVSVEADDSGRLIGVGGETLDALQLIVNQIISRHYPDNFKRVIIDSGHWRQNKEAELENKAKRWANDVIESGDLMELAPMPSWQRRVIHSIISEIDGVYSVSEGVGKDRHLLIKPGSPDPALVNEQD